MHWLRAGNRGRFVRRSYGFSGESADRLAYYSVGEVFHGYESPLRSLLAKGDIRKGGDCSCIVPVLASTIVACGRVIETVVPWPGSPTMLTVPPSRTTRS